MTDKNDTAKTGQDHKWSNGAMAGAAVGSAALLAALMFAGRQYKQRQQKKPELKIHPEGLETD